ncbi:MAG TPA: hypothetical protein VGJ13_18500 [Pseudonocardiaceae bacterium]
MSHDDVEGVAGQGEQDLSEMRQRMAVIKEEVTAEVEEKWVTPYRTPAVFDLKVQARLASHEEYRSLQDRVRDAQAAQSSAAE